MTMQTITLQIPSHTYQRVRRVAQTLKHSMEAILSDAIATGLAPFYDLPSAIVDEFRSLVFFSDTDLWKVARGRLPQKHYQQMDTLLALKGQGKITAAEQAELAQLLEEYQVFILRKGQAAVLLQRRGFDMSDPAVLYQPA